MLILSQLRSSAARVQQARQNRRHRAQSNRSRRFLKLEQLEDRSLLSTFTVINTNDSGAGSFRQALLDANSNAGSDDVAFNIPGSGVKTITPTSGLPTISGPVTIDGYTQPGSSANTLAVGDNANLLIELNGSSGFSGLAISGSNCTIRGLVINRFSGYGIDIFSGAGNNAVQGNFIGVDPSGAVGLGNTAAGIEIFNVPNNVIGGVTPDARNIISSNHSQGIVISAPAAGNRVQGNYIGTDATGTVALGNTFEGVFLNSAPVNTLIGGTTAGAGNVISGNGLYGVSIVGGANGNLVQGNFIGTDATGMLAIGNHAVGVNVGGPSNVIGGTTPNARNVISGNSSNGVELDGSSNTVQGNFIGTNALGTSGLANNGAGVFVFGTTNAIGGTTSGAGNVIGKSGNSGISLFGGSNLVQGNFIGTDVSGTINLGNTGNGVRILTASNTIGGTATGSGNTIAFSTSAGVAVTGSSGGNAIRGNSIFSNGGLGIDLNSDGVTANDLGDPDTGPNNRQNFPVLTSVSRTGGGISVIGSLNSTANTSFDLDFFASPSADPTNFGEGKQVLGSTTVTTNGSGNASFSVVLLASVPGAQSISATATDAAGNTSEFSSDLILSANSPPIANAGGPYTITYGDGVTLDASGSSDPENDTLTYSWTVNGHVNAASGAHPALSYITLVGLSVFTAGSYPVSVTVDDGHGGVVTSSVTTLTVNKAGSITTIGTANATYDGSPHGASAVWASTGTDGEGALLTIVVYLGVNGTSYGPTIAPPKNAGDYKALATFDGDANHISSNSAANFTIFKAASTTTTLGDGPFSYDGTSHSGGTGTVIGAGGLNTSATSFTYSGDQINAGTYYVTAHYAGDGNHEASDGDPAAITINKASSTTITVGDGPFTYDGTTYTGGSGTVTGAGGLSTVATSLTYSGDQIDAGTYYVTAHYAGDTNHEASDGDAVAITINKASSTTVTVGDGPFTYDGTTHSGGSGTVTGAGGLSTSATSLTYSGDQVDAGIYYVTAHYAGDANHEASDGDAVAITINKSSSTTVTGGDVPFTYDGTTHYGGSGTVTGAGGLITVATSLTYSGDQVDAGTYYVTAHYTGDANHESSDGDAVAITINKSSSTTVTVGDGPFTYDGTMRTGGSGAVTGAGGLSTVATSLTYSGDQVDAGTYYVTAHYTGDANHEASNGDAVAITINKASSTTITVGDGPFTYDGTSHSGGSGTVTGAGSLITVATSLTYSGDQVDAGTYYVTAHFAGDANHEASAGDPVAITINKAQAAIALVTYSVVYDGNAHTATGTATGVMNESLAGLSLNATTHTSAGTYIDSWTFTDVTGNYQNASGSVSDFIATRALTITAKSVIKAFGQTVTFAGTEFTVSGLVSGDSVASVTLSSAGASSTAGVGTYPIVPSAASGAGLANYLINYVNGTLSVIVDTNLGILLLDPTGKGALSVSGNGVVKVTGSRGEIVVDSSNAQAITASGNGSVSAAEIDAKGDSVSGHATVHDSDNIFTYAPEADPLASLAAPSVPSNIRSASTLNISGGNVTLQPGLYVGGIKISGQASVTLAPGIYYLQGGGFSVSGQATVTGTDVMLYNAAATAGDAISFSGQGNVNLSGLEGGVYQGIAIFQARGSTSAINLSGQGNVNVVGMIYATGAAVKLSGNGNLNMTGLQKTRLAGDGTVQIADHLIAADLQVSGNGGVFVDVTGNAFLPGDVDYYFANY